MLKSIESAKRVFRHASDDQLHDCGRACVQMIATALRIGVDRGCDVPSDRATTRATITQPALRAMEQSPANVPNGWCTDPGELADLLRRSTGDAGWRVACDADPKYIFAAMLKSLRSGKPAVLNYEASDHWVCVFQADTEDDALANLRWWDPLNPTLRSIVDPDCHTYVDECRFDGETIDVPESMTPQQLGGNSLPVDSVALPQYTGKCVAVVWGDLPTPEEVNSVRFAASELPAPAIDSPIEAAKHQLDKFARRFRLDQLARILATTSDPIIRTVSAIDGGPNDSYTLGAAFSDQFKAGFVAAFDRLWRVMHVQITGDRPAISALRLTKADEHLWFAHKKLRVADSPYRPYQFRNERYERLLDREIFIR